MESIIRGVYTMTEEAKQQCNLGIGQLKDDVNVVKAAVRYLLRTRTLVPITEEVCYE